MKIQQSYITGADRVTWIIACGTFCVAIALTLLIFLYDIVHGSPLRIRFWVGLGIVSYTLLIAYLARRKYIKTANWLLILIYELLAGVILINWGLGSSVGILTASFALLLPGIFMTPKSILPVAIITLLIMLTAHTLHTLGIVTPVTYIPPNPASILDVVAYGTILSVFALVSWVSAKQSIQSLQRALSAEESLRKQKENLAIELANESMRLRQAQLEQIQQLYKFAVIGQSTSAVLHELSNHLSILNLDIDDIKQQHRHSKAIANAEDGIDHINRMVRKAREQLGSAKKNPTTFNALEAINQSLIDSSSKLRSRKIRLLKNLPKNHSTFFVTGDPLSLMQCLSILLNNAAEACADVKNPQVKLSASILDETLTITILDNGPGVDKSLHNKIFQPVKSTKPTGMGVGLYIAKHLIESQFVGTLEHTKSNSGAQFQISISSKTPA